MIQYLCDGCQKPTNDVKGEIQKPMLIAGKPGLLTVGFVVKTITGRLSEDFRLCKECLKKALE